MQLKQTVINEKEIMVDFILKNSDNIIGIFFLMFSLEITIRKLSTTEGFMGFFLM